MGVDAFAALSKSGAYHRGLVPVFRCLLRPLPLHGRTNADRLVTDGYLFMVGRYALQFPSCFSLCDIGLRMISVLIPGHHSSSVYVTADVWTIEEILLGIRWNVLHIS